MADKDEKDTSKVGGVPDSSDNKGVDETLGDYNTDEETEKWRHQ